MLNGDFAGAGKYVGDQFTVGNLTDTAVKGILLGFASKFAGNKSTVYNGKKFRIKVF